MFHEIETGDSRPFRQPARRVTYGEQRAAIETKIQKLVDAHIARRSTSLWASLVVMVTKTDGSWRMCVKYRRVNKESRFDCFSLPRLDEAIVAFAGTAVFPRSTSRWLITRCPLPPPTSRRPRLSHTRTSRRCSKCRLASATRRQRTSA